MRYRAKPEPQALPPASEQNAAIDDLLRQSLEPDPARVRALVDAALAAAPEQQDRRHDDASDAKPWRWAVPATVVAAFGAAVLLALLAWPIDPSRHPSTTARPDTVVAPVSIDDTAPADRTLSPGNTGPARNTLAISNTVSISNIDGPLTVTTPGGGRWIVLNRPGDNP